MGWAVLPAGIAQACIGGSEPRCLADLEIAQALVVKLERGCFARSDVNKTFVIGSGSGRLARCDIAEAFLLTGIVQQTGHFDALAGPGFRVFLGVLLAISCRSRTDRAQGLVDRLAILGRHIAQVFIGEVAAHPLVGIVTAAGKAHLDRLHSCAGRI